MVIARLLESGSRKGKYGVPAEITGREGYFSIRKHRTAFTADTSADIELVNMWLDAGGFMKYIDNSGLVSSVKSDAQGSSFDGNLSGNLSVVGTANITGATTLGSNLTVGGAGYVTGTLTTGGALTSPSLLVSGSGSVGTLNALTSLTVGTTTLTSSPTTPAVVTGGFKLSSSDIILSNRSDSTLEQVLDKADALPTPGGGAAMTGAAIFDSMNTTLLRSDRILTHPLEFNMNVAGGDTGSVNLYYNGTKIGTLEPQNGYVQLGTNPAGFTQLNLVGYPGAALYLGSSGAQLTKAQGVTLEGLGVGGNADTLHRTSHAGVFAADSTFNNASTTGMYIINGEVQVTTAGGAGTVRIDITYNARNGTSKVWSSNTLDLAGLNNLNFTVPVYHVTNGTPASVSYKLVQASGAWGAARVAIDITVVKQSN
jgi:hypothetical protein